jgi:hypothetical protein
MPGLQDIIPPVDDNHGPVLDMPSQDRTLLGLYSLDMMGNANIVMRKARTHIQDAAEMKAELDPNNYSLVTLGDSISKSLGITDGDDNLIADKSAAVQEHMQLFLEARTATKQVERDIRYVCFPPPGTEGDFLLEAVAASHAAAATITSEDIKGEILVTALRELITAIKQRGKQSKNGYRYARKLSFMSGMRIEQATRIRAGFRLRPDGTFRVDRSFKLAPLPRAGVRKGPARRLASVQRNQPDEMEEGSDDDGDVAELDDEEADGPMKL